MRTQTGPLFICLTFLFSWVDLDTNNVVTGKGHIAAMIEISKRNKFSNRNQCNSRALYIHYSLIPQDRPRHVAFFFLKSSEAIMRFHYGCPFANTDPRRRVDLQEINSAFFWMYKTLM
ncbi:hypothetical protein V1515DRAFT_607994, partial [Lipomyces mesembrius]